MNEPDTHIASRVIDAHKRLDTHDQRLNTLELNGAVAEERSRQIQASLVKIESSIGRVVWIVGTAVIGAIVTFVVRGGLHVQ